jgi:hypothetical protein
MTVRAVGVELSTVFVGVACGTRRRQAEIRMIQVLDPDHFAQCWRYVLSRVAAIAGRFHVPAYEHVPRLLVIEIIVRRLPFHYVEIRTQVFGVAACALLIAGSVLDDVSVETPLFSQLLADLRVAT